MELLCLALYPVSWLALFGVSTSYWFLPAGLRMGALLMLRRRTWAWMAILEWLVILGLRLWNDTFQSHPALVLSVLLPWCAYAATVWISRPHSIVTLTPRSMSRLTIAALIAAAANAVILTGALWIDRSRTDITHHLFSFTLGNFIGTLLLVPLLLMAREALLSRRPYWKTLLANGLVFVPLALVGLSALPIAGWEKYSLIFALVPLFWVASHAGWRAGCIAVALLSAAVYVADAALFASWDPLQLQLLIAVTACATLLIGSTSETVGEQGRALSRMVDMLSTRTRALSDAADRLSSQQEDDRRRLGRELHDELGQDMTAIATQLRLVERSVQDPELRNSLRAIERLVDTAHDHLRDAINHLHPLVLDRFGLSRALVAGPIAEMTRAKRIDYRCSIDGDIDTLPSNVTTAIYRICQEAATNGVRHGCGERIHLHVLAEPTAKGETCVTLRIEDDAGGLDIAPHHFGFGLQGIQDRANALGASYRFNPASGRPRHWLQMRLSQASGELHATEARRIPELQPAEV